MRDRTVGVLGASSLVGDCLLPLLRDQGRQVFAFSRSLGDGSAAQEVSWIKLDEGGPSGNRDLKVESWVSLAPIWVLRRYFRLLEDHGAKRVVALSSTSRFTKGSSSDPIEQELAQRIADSEEQLADWAERRGVEWVILRPTLIYGLGRDKNVCEIARFIRRFGFFPLLGKADGLRQPIHARDVAKACITALTAPISHRAYNISGAETMSYCVMVERVFKAEQIRTRFVPVPKALFRAGIAALRPLPRFRGWSIGMAERMNRDLSFSHAEAARDLGFSPSGFEIGPDDLPR